MFQDLVSELKSELRSNLEQAVVALMMTAVEYDAEQIHHAIAVSVAFSFCNWITEIPLEKFCLVFEDLSQLSEFDIFLYWFSF